MKVLPINNNYRNKTNFHNQKNFRAYTLPNGKTLPVNLTKEGKAVLNYIEQLCPKTKECEKIFKKTFVPEIYDLYRMGWSVETILEKCGNNIELIERALGKYGLELYGGFPQGSLIKNARKEIKETGYWSKYDALNTNFINDLDYNPSGTLAELQERFGSHAPLWLSRHKVTGQVIEGLFTYRVVYDMCDGTSSLNIEAQTLRNNAIRKYLDRSRG